MKKLFAALLLALLPALAYPQAGQFGSGVTDLSTLAAPYKDAAFSGTVTASAFNLIPSGGSPSFTCSSGTITASAPCINITQTWNNAAVTFIGADMNVTNTNSAASSLIQRWRVGGVTSVGINNAGALQLGGAAGAAAAQSPGAVAGVLQVAGTGAANTTITFTNWGTSGTDNTAPRIDFAKARGGAVGTHGAVVAGTDLSIFRIYGSDGTAFALAGTTLWEADGTVASGIVPSRYTINTANSAGTNSAAVTIDSNQRVLLSGSGATLGTALTVGQSNRLQVAGNATVIGGISTSRFSADALGTNIECSKSRSGTIGTNTIVQSGDVLCTLTAYGANGTTYTPAGYVQFKSAGTPGATNDMPGSVVIGATADGAGTVTDVVTVDAGTVTLAKPLITGGLPTIGACGTNPSLVGSDNGMVLTVGTGGAATTCAATFSRTYANAPACVAQNNTDRVAYSIATTTTTVTITATAAFTAGSKFHVVCMPFA